MPAHSTPENPAGGHREGQPRTGLDLAQGPSLPLLALREGLAQPCHSQQGLTGFWSLREDDLRLDRPTGRTSLRLGWWTRRPQPGPGRGHSVITGMINSVITGIIISPQSSLA